MHARPSRDSPRADDGYFGPKSATWKVYSDSGATLGAVASVLLQALDTGMLNHFDHVSITSESPEAGQARFDRTGDFIITCAFGDKAHVDAATAHVDMLHERATWTNPETGTEHVAKWPEWQRWTMYTFIWGSLEGALKFGVNLSQAEQDAFVKEQQIIAEKLHVPGPHPETKAELDAFIEDGKKTKALNYLGAQAALGLRNPPKTKNPVNNWISRAVLNGILSLLPLWARQIYGVENISEQQLARSQRTTARFLAIARKNKTLQDMVDNGIAHATEHPYRKVRAKA
ncbi:oxygenase MpaB family protein [Microbacterium sp. NPDC076911]|uniref:oxygenase MpaB family protein n=1 Tax=Microbacterium sp. NPDC076911 TaxID=3154958 RepID=UPI00344652C7